MSYYASPFEKNIHVGQRIAEARRQSGLTQVEFAQRLDISQSKLSRLEKLQDNILKDSILNKISNLFNIDLQWLETGIGGIRQSLNEAEQSYGKLFLTAMNKMVQETTNKVEYLMQCYNNCGHDSVVAKAVAEEMGILQSLRKAVQEEKKINEEL
jgi:transcriptional regulator with XRE-family HTH domain